MIAIARSQAPLAEFQVQDIENAVFPEQSFDGAWACCSLCHISKKALPQVLRTIHSLLKEGGCFYLTLKKGTGEVFERDRRYQADYHKFWAFFEEEELKQLVELAKFKIFECCTVHRESAYQTHDVVRIFCRKEFS